MSEEFICCGEIHKDIEIRIRKDERRKIYEQLKPYEWSGLHTDDEDDWAVMTRACPFCFNAKSNGHKESCLFKKLKDEFDGS